jgi:transcriptional regulator with XRE-family HTH domain
MSEVADRVRRAIALDGRTHHEFAEAVGLDPTKLSKSLSGVRKFSSFELASIAEQTNVTVYQLLGVADPADAIIANIRGYADTLADRPWDALQAGDVAREIYKRIIEVN